MKRGRGNPVRLLRSCAVEVAKMDRACPVVSIDRIDAESPGVETQDFYTLPIPGLR
jgi:hypothetical protein